MGNIVSKALLEKYLDHHCTPEETVLVEAYLQQPGSEEVLQELLAERLSADMEQSMQTEDDPEQKAVWAAQMRERMGRSAKVMPIRRIWRYVAVSAAVLAGLGAFTLYRFSKPPQQHVALLQKNNANGQRAMIRLSDGSEILLGAGSHLEYPESFTGEKREIRLTGEAFFKISNDPVHPFVVRTGNIATTVLGTSFKISAFRNKPLTVAVATGKVRVDYQEGDASWELAILTPGREVTWESGHAKLKAVAVEDVQGWEKGRLAYNNRPLEEITADLERWYNVKINFSHPEKATERITVTLYGGVSLERTLETLAAGSGFHYTIGTDKVLIH